MVKFGLPPVQDMGTVSHCAGVCGRRSSTPAVVLDTAEAVLRKETNRETAAVRMRGSRKYMAEVTDVVRVGMSAQ